MVKGTGALWLMERIIIRIACSTKNEWLRTHISRPRMQPLLLKASVKGGDKRRNWRNILLKHKRRMYAVYLYHFPVDALPSAVSTIAID